MNNPNTQPTKRMFIIPKIETKKTPRKGLNKRQKSAILVSTAFILMVMIFASFMAISQWYDNNRVMFHYPIEIKLFTPVRIVRRPHTTGILSPLGGSSAKPTVFDVGAISDKIYTLESSGGKNDGCRDLGKYNGYGFRQNSSEWICYSSHEEVRGHVIAWLEQHIKAGDLDKALCMYNQGIDETKCTYAINYQSL